MYLLRALFNFSAVQVFICNAIINCLSMYTVHTEPIFSFLSIFVISELTEFEAIYGHATLKFCTISLFSERWINNRWIRVTTFQLQYFEVNNVFVMKAVIYFAVIYVTLVLLMYPNVIVEVNIYDIYDAATYRRHCWFHNRVLLVLLYV